MPAAIARAAIAPVLAEPRVRAEQVTQLVLGETAAVVERTGDWRRVCTHVDGYDGWVQYGLLDRGGGSGGGRLALPRHRLE